MKVQFMKITGFTKTVNTAKKKFAASHACIKKKNNAEHQ